MALRNQSALSDVQPPPEKESTLPACAYRFGDTHRKHCGATMIEYKRDLARWIRLLLSREMTASDLNCFVAYLHELATRQLTQQNVKALAHFVLSGYRTEDAAFLLIEDLVLPKEDIPCYSLYRSLQSLPVDCMNATLREPEDFLARIIAVAIRDALHRIYAEWDSTYSRVRRAVEDHFRNHDGYGIIQQFKEKIAYRINNGAPHPYSNRCTREEMLLQLHRFGADRHGIGGLVDLLFDFVERQHDYDPALAVSDISFALRDYFFQRWKLEYSDMTLAEDRLLHSDVSGLKTVTERHMKTRVLNRYIATGSMSEEEAQKMLGAISAHLDDIINLGKRQLYCYFREQYPDVRYDEYRTERRSRFEYIMHLSEEYFVKKCREVLEG
jgi:hypothetical protein